MTEKSSDSVVLLGRDEEAGCKQAKTVTSREGKACESYLVKVEEGLTLPQPNYEERMNRDHKLSSSALLILKVMDQ